MPGELHRHGFGYARAYEVAHGGSTEILRDAPGASRGDAGVLPSLVEANDRPRILLSAAFVGHHADEHVRHEVTGFLQPLVLGALGLEEPPQFRGERKYAALTVLRPAGVKTDLASSEVDLVPFERQYLAGDPPAGDVRERDHRPQACRQVREDATVLLGFEESRSHVVFAEERDVRLHDQLACLNREAERALQRRQLSIDLGVRGRTSHGGYVHDLACRQLDATCRTNDDRIRLALRDVLANVGRGDAGHAAAAEEGLEMLREPTLEHLQRTFTIRAVVVDHVVRRFVEAELAELRRDRHAARDVSFAQLQQRDRIALLAASGALVVPPAVSRVPNPPDATTFAKSAHPNLPKLDPSASDSTTIAERAIRCEPVSREPFLPLLDDPVKIPAIEPHASGLRRANQRYVPAKCPIA